MTKTSAADKDRGARFKEARLNKGISQTALAEELGISSLTVSLWERGLSFPQPSNSARVSEALGVSIAYLRTGKED